MSEGLKASDWTVEHDGDEGTVRSTEYRGRFRIDRCGAVRIIWRDGPGRRTKARLIRPLRRRSRRRLDRALSRLADPAGLIVAALAVGTPDP